MSRALRSVVSAFVLMALSAACATTGSVPATVAPSELPRTLAVLPFVPLPEKEEQTRVLQRMIFGALSATPYDVVKPQVVEERLVRAGLADPRELTKRDPSEIARILRVDALLYGELTHWDRVFLAVYSQVAAGASIKLVDARNGQTVFERAEISRSHEGGLPTNALSAAIQVVQSAWNLREIALIRACDNLVRDLLKDIPTPLASEARRPPVFGNVLSDGAGRVLKAGDVVTVVAQGQPGVIGSFDITPLAKNLALEEASEGIYVGRYTVKPGDTAADAYVVARLADSTGRASEREDVLGRFNVDTVPPATPASITARFREGAVQLAWAANVEPDLAGYRVYRSDSALTGFALVATTEMPMYRDSAERMVFYRVAAVDRAGNESAPSASVALPVLASVLSGVLMQESYLVPANSPYVVQGGITIDGGATLHVMPGVVVRFAPGAEGIVVKDGAVIARGTTEQRIILTSGSERPRAGDFRAGLHVRAKPGQVSVVEYASLTYGAVGIRVDSGAVEALRLDMTDNLQGGIEVAETGALKLSESRITGHSSGSGLTVRGFGRAQLRGNQITENGWAVVNYSGNEVDARENWWGDPVPSDALFVGNVDRRDPLAIEQPLSLR
jgi:hypothetical protein